MLLKKRKRLRQQQQQQILKSYWLNSDRFIRTTTSIIIAAQGERNVLGDKTEQYHWVQPVSLEGQQQRTQNLSNNNLTRTTGTSSLILTED
jgi:hypothetical protein